MERSSLLVRFKLCALYKLDLNIIQNQKLQSRVRAYFLFKWHFSIGTGKVTSATFTLVT